MGNRRMAREIALQVLYQMDLQEALSPAQGMGLFWQHFGGAIEDGEVDESTRHFAAELVAGVREHLPELDGVIWQRVSQLASRAHGTGRLQPTQARRSTSCVTRRMCRPR